MNMISDECFSDLTYAAAIAGLVAGAFACEAVLGDEAVEDVGDAVMREGSVKGTIEIGMGDGARFGR